MLKSKKKEEDHRSNLMLLCDLKGENLLLEVSTGFGVVLEYQFGGMERPQRHL